MGFIAQGRLIRSRTMRRWINRLMTTLLALCLGLTLLPLFLILAYLLIKGVGSLNWDFFTQLPGSPGEAHTGMANAIYGSGLMVVLASVIGIPIGVFAAVYVTEYGRGPLAHGVRFVADLLNGTPSIVIGMFAWTVLVLPLGHFSGWAGAFALGVIMIPVVMRTTEEALRLVPQTVREAALALGVPSWAATWWVTLRAARPGIITGILLAVGRVAGETAPLLLTASTNLYWPRSPNDWTPSLPVSIFNGAISPFPDWQKQAWSAALVLMTLVLVLNVSVRLIAPRRTS